LCRQPGRGARTLPPRGARRRQPGRLPLGPAAQAGPAAGRTPGRRTGAPLRMRPAHVAPPSALAVATALASVYLVWGSTYLAIRVGLEGCPPFLMGRLRFIAAALAFYAFLRWRGHAPPPRAQWRNAAVMGLFMMLLGNGMV